MVCCARASGGCDEFVGEFVGEAGSPHLARDRDRVVGDTADRRCDVVAVRFEHGEGRPWVTVFGLADRSAVNEADAAVVVDPGFMGVAEDE
jgi:hypothetical protein